MKKYFLILFTVCAIQTCYSQTEKGKMFIGGGISLSGNSNNRLDTLFKSDANNWGISIAPNFGYFISDNFAIGANINFEAGSSNGNTEYSNLTPPLPKKYTSESTVISLGLSVFARYYVNISDKFKFFINGGVNFLNTTEKRNYSNNDPNFIYPTNNPASQEIKTNTVSIAVSPGLVYFITPKMGIQATFGNINYKYSSSENKSLLYDNHNNTSSYGANLNLSGFSLGLNYYF